MNKGLGLALLTIGIALLIYGINASGSLSSDVARAFTGSPTNKALWLLLGGIGSTILGVVMTFKHSHKT